MHDSQVWAAFTSSRYLIKVVCASTCMCQHTQICSRWSSCVEQFASKHSLCIHLLEDYRHICWNCHEHKWEQFILHYRNGRIIIIITILRPTGQTAKQAQ